MIRIFYLILLPLFFSKAYSDNEWASILLDIEGNGIVKYSANPKSGFHVCEDNCVIRVNTGTEIKISASAINEDNSISFSNCDNTYANKFCSLVAYDNRKISIDFNNLVKHKEEKYLSKKFIDMINFESISEDVVISSKQVISYKSDYVVASNFDKEYFDSIIFNILYEHACSINFKNNFDFTEVVLLAPDIKTSLLVNEQSCGSNSTLKIKTSDDIELNKDFEESIILIKDYGSHMSVEVDYRFDVNSIKEGDVYISKGTRMNNMRLIFRSSKINKYGNHAITFEMGSFD